MRQADLGTPHARVSALEVVRGSEAMGSRGLRAHVAGRRVWRQLRRAFPFHRRPAGRGVRVQHELHGELQQRIGRVRVHWNGYQLRDELHERNLRRPLRSLNRLFADMHADRNVQAPLPSRDDPQRLPGHLS
jgi:hypothetical protein